jgi:4-hydroxybenzoate polyprenyltransferase
LFFHYTPPESVGLLVISFLSFRVILSKYFAVYDTIYAHQDKDDDRRVGLHSTALLFGERHAKKLLSVFGAGSIAFLAASGYAAGMHSVFYTSVAGAALHMALQVSYVDLNNRASCFKTFLSNSYLGGIIAIGVFLDRILY